MVDLSDADRISRPLPRRRRPRPRLLPAQSLWEMETRGLTLQEAPAYEHSDYAAFAPTRRPKSGGVPVEGGRPLPAAAGHGGAAPRGSDRGAQASVCRRGWRCGNSGPKKRGSPPDGAPAGGEAPLASTFVGVIRAVRAPLNLAGIQRLPLPGASDVAVEVTLADGRRDLLVAIDPAKRASPVAVLAPPSPAPGGRTVLAAP